MYCIKIRTKKTISSRINTDSQNYGNFKVHDITLF